MATEADLLTDIRERFDDATNEWAHIREEGSTDMRYVAGDPWSAKERAAREAAMRPCLSFDELGQYTNQVVNDSRMNPRAMKFTPTGNGANDAGAEWYANKAREVEYRSHAQAAYTTAYQNCIERSYGWVRLYTKHKHDRTFEQEVWIGEIQNPDMVLPDTSFLNADGADMEFLYFFEKWKKGEFKRRFKDAQFTSFNSELMGMAPSWLDGDNVQVAEYWTKEVARQRRLLMIKPPPDRNGDRAGEPFHAYQDDLDEAGIELSSDDIIKARNVDEFKVTQRLTNGVEVLSETPWAGKYIPFVSCLGKILYVDQGSGSKRQIMSMTRLARNPIMFYAYLRTCEAEAIGGVPRSQWVGYQGQFHNPDEWAKANREPVPFLEANPFTEATGMTNLLPLPVRQPWDPAIQNLEIAAEAARRAIQAAMGQSPLPTQAQRQNEKSGVALKQIEKSGQIGSFHFSDHFDYMIRQVAVCFEDLAPYIYDTPRDDSIRKPDETADIVRINDPNPPKGQTDPIFTKGDYLVTVSSGPAADSQRDAVSDFVQTLSQIPEVMQQCGDLIVRLQSRTMNLGPVMDELAERLTPPQFKEQDGADPQQMQQQLAMGKQQVQQLQQALGKATQAIQTDQAKQQATIAKAQIDAKAKVAQAHLDGTMALQLQRMKDAAQLGAARIAAGQQAAEGQDEAAALLLSQAHEAAQNNLDRVHELMMAKLDHQHALAQQDAAQQDTLEQGAQGVAGQMAVQDNAPQPEGGE